MFPHERSLVKDLADRPFALLGVNSDKDLVDLKKKNAAEQITWRSFWNGPNGTSGPISTDWNVSGWPTIYLIDHDGKIAQKWLGNPGDEVVAAEIEKLVVIAEGAKKAPGSNGGGEEDSATQDSETVADVIAAYGKVYDAFIAEIRKVSSREEQEQVVKDKEPKAAEWAKRMQAVVDANKGTEEAAKGLVWIAGNLRDQKVQAAASATLIAEYMESEAIGDLCMALVYAQDEHATSKLENILSKTKHASVQGKASYALASRLKSSMRRSALTPEVEARVVALLEKVVAEHADVVVERLGKIADAAARDLFEIRNLQVGKTAPDIKGVDTDGVEFKLSDYRGKVVMLDFWGHW